MNIGTIGDCVYHGLVMTGLKKMQRALSDRGSPEVPVVVCYEGIAIRDHWEEITARPWWHIHHPDIEAQLSWRSDAIRALGQDWYRVCLCPSRHEREQTVIEERPNGVYATNTRSGTSTPLARPLVGGWPGSGGNVSVRPVTVALDRQSVDLLIKLPRKDSVQHNRDRGRFDLAHALRRGPGRNRFALQHIASPLWSCYGLWGFEDMMTLVVDDPDLVEYACERYLLEALADVGEAAAMGAHGVWIEECMTDIISPRAYRRLCLPGVRALVEEIRRQGMQSIHYYCGDPAGRLDVLLDTGANALSLEESKKGFHIDIKDVVRQAGPDITILGNLDAVGILQNGTDDELAHEVRRQLAAGRGLSGSDPGSSRFVMSLGSPVTPSTPIERVREYCRLVRGAPESRS